MKTVGNEPIVPVPEFGNLGALGLTKREFMATMLATGLIGDKTISLATVSSTAVSAADMLIEQLNKDGHE